VTRLYLPATLHLLANLEQSGSLMVGNDAVRAADDSEDAEYAALMTAAETSAVLAAELDPGERRRVVVVAEVPAPFASIVQQLAVLPIPQRGDAELTSYVRGVVAGLVDRELLRQKQELLGRLQRTDRSDTATFAAVQQALVTLEQERRALRGD